MSDIALNYLIAVGGASAAAQALTGVSNSVTSLIQQIGGAAAVAHIFRSGIDDILESSGRLVDLSARTGEHIRDLVVLERAYSNAGRGTEAIGANANLLQKALSGVNEAGEKTDKVFGLLGLNIEQLRKQSYYENLQSLTRGLSGIPNPAQRAAIAMQLFGRSGGEMLQLIGDPNALQAAEQEVGRYAERLSKEAETFDALGDRISIVKLRLREMWLVAAEQLLPTLQMVADATQSINLSVVGASLPSAAVFAGTLIGGKMSEKLIDKIESGLMEWATRPDPVIGQAFAGKLVGWLPNALRSASLWGTVAVGLFEALKGGYTAFKEWRNGQVQTSAIALDTATKVGKQAGAISSESDRVDAQLSAIRAIKAVEAGLAEANGRLLANDPEIANYNQALAQLHATLRTLNSEWADNRIKTNEAAAAASVFAAAEKDALSWLTGDKGKEALAKDRLETFKAKPAWLREIEADTQLKSFDRGTQRGIDELKASGSNAQLAQFRVQRDAIRREILALLTDARSDLNREAEQLSANRLSALQGRREVIDSNPWLTKGQKQDSRAALIREENKELDSQIAALEKRASLTAEDQGRLDRLQQKRASNENDRSGMGFMETQAAGLMDWANGLGTVAEQVAGTISSTIGSAISSVSDGIYGWITGAKSFASAMRELGGTILRSIIQTIIQIGVQWGVTHALAALGFISLDTLQTGLLAKKVVEVNAAEAATMPAKTAGAAAASVSSFGIAAAIGIAAVLAMIAMFGGFAGGGHTGSGANDQVAGVVHANEWVAPAWMVKDPELGSVIADLEARRSGSIRGYALGGMVANVDSWKSSTSAPSMNLWRYSDLSSAQTAQASSSNNEASSRPLMLTLVDSRREAARISRGSEAEDQILDVVRRNKYTLAP